MTMKLLPHSFNRIAIGWLIIWLVIDLLDIYVFKSHFIRSITPVPGIINTIALFIACFSSEKIEDERIRQMRLSSVAIVAIIAFLADILRFTGGLFKWTHLRDVIESFQTDFPIWVFLYIAIFKAFVLIDRKRAEHEE